MTDKYFFRCFFLPYELDCFPSRRHFYVTFTVSKMKQNRAWLLRHKLNSTFTKIHLFFIIPPAVTL